MKRSYRYRIQEFSLTHLRYSRRRPALRSKISLPRPMNYFALTPIMATQALRHEKRYAIKSPFFTVRRECMNEPDRSEEHTSELHHDSISYAVFCLKKKKYCA